MVHCDVWSVKCKWYFIAAKRSGESEYRRLSVKAAKLVVQLRCIARMPWTTLMPLGAVSARLLSSSPRNVLRRAMSMWPTNYEDPVEHKSMIRFGNSLSIKFTAACILIVHCIIICNLLISVEICARLVTSKGRRWCRSRDAMPFSVESLNCYCESPSNFTYPCSVSHDYFILGYSEFDHLNH